MSCSFQSLYLRFEWMYFERWEQPIVVAGKSMTAKKIKLSLSDLPENALNSIPLTKLVLSFLKSYSIPLSTDTLGFS